MNARYQKHTEPAGKTRKSAAAAKPVRKEGGTATSSAKTKTSGSGGSTARVPYDPQTPEFKRLRTWWWSLLGGGLVLVALSWAIRQYTQFPAKLTVATVALSLAYFCIGVAFYLDLVKMRPMRKEWQASQKKAAK